ncbi:putative cyclin [Helianthus annuus]|nr:putative cyclin [Helianthus annuus]
MEVHRRPIADYIEKVQKDVGINMSRVLIDWLVEVAEEYKLLSHTLYLTVSYIDKFLSVNVLNRKGCNFLVFLRCSSQCKWFGIFVVDMFFLMNWDWLLNTNCMRFWYNRKYEEISLLHTEDFCYITDNTYTKQEVVKMEADVLKALNFEMGNPTVKSFLRYELNVVYYWLLFLKSNLLLSVFDFNKKEKL